MKLENQIFMTFSLLLHALGPKPDRKALEEITVNVPAIARADSGGLLSDWFGIVTSGLSIQDAHAFQNGLRTLGCETDIVPDSDIPALHADFRCHLIDLDGENITLTTAMNRSQVRARHELVFAAAGVVDRDRFITEYRPSGNILDHIADSMTPNAPEAGTNLKVRIEEFSHFRIDLFFSKAPHRISLEMKSDSVITYGGRPIGLKNTTELTVLMCDLQTLLPPSRQNLALRTLSTAPLYPSLHAYEEEVRWMFHRLGAKG